MLGNQEILGKCQMWIETQPSVQSSFQKLNVHNSCQKNTQNQMLDFRNHVEFYCISLVCSKYFGQDCLRKQTFGCNLAQCPSHLNIWIFSVTAKHFSNHDVNIKQGSSVKNSKFNDFVLALFCILGLGQNFTLENFQLCLLVLFGTS